MGMGAIIATNLREIRILRKLTQEAVAAKANLQANYYACVERNEKTLSLESLVKISKVLKIEPYILLKSEGFRELR